jgi:hypothetical protein
MRRGEITCNNIANKNSNVRRASDIIGFDTTYTNMREK